MVSFDLIKKQFFMKRECIDHRLICQFEIDLLSLPGSTCANRNVSISAKRLYKNPTEAYVFIRKFFITKKSVIFKVTLEPGKEEALGAGWVELLTFLVDKLELKGPPVPRVTILFEDWVEWLLDQERPIDE